MRSGHLVCGVLDDWSSDFDCFRCEGDAAISFVFSKQVANSTPVRVPAKDRRGQSRMLGLWFVKIGADINPVEWAKRQVTLTDAAEPQKSAILFVQICHGGIKDKDWQDITSSPRQLSEFVRRAILARNITKDELINIFNPGRTSHA